MQKLAYVCSGNVGYSRLNFPKSVSDSLNIGPGSLLLLDSQDSDTLIIRVVQRGFN